MSEPRRFDTSIAWPMEPDLSQRSAVARLIRPLALVRASAIATSFERSSPWAPAASAATSALKAWTRPSFAAASSRSSMRALSPASSNAPCFLSEATWFTSSWPDMAFTRATMTEGVMPLIAADGDPERDLRVHDRAGLRRGILHAGDRLEGGELAVRGRIVVEDDPLGALARLYVEERVEALQHLPPVERDHVERLRLGLALTDVALDLRPERAGNVLEEPAGVDLLPLVLLALLLRVLLVGLLVAVDEVHDARDLVGREPAEE